MTCSADLTAPVPHRRWVADFTHVAIWSGVVLYSRAVVGWSAATSNRTKLVLDVLQMALWRRNRAGRTVEKGLIDHSGSQYTSFAFPCTPASRRHRRLGSVGDALDNVLMESTIGL